MARNMIFFAVLFVVLLVAPDVYIAMEYISPSASGIVKVLWWLPTVLTLACFVLANREIMHNTSMRVFFALVLCVALPKLLFVILQFVLSPLAALVTALVPVAIFAYGFFFGWRRIVVRKAVCESELLPQSFDGYRILQLSDLHIGTFLKNKSFIRKLVNVVNEQHADLSTAIQQLIEDIEAGRKYMKVYKQMKMYNDPALNPVLYASKK